MENDNTNSEHELKPAAKSSSGTGVLSSLIFLVIVIIGMIILAHFKGN